MGSRRRKKNCQYFIHKKRQIIFYRNNGLQTTAQKTELKMKEDVIEKAIKQFALILRMLSGSVNNYDFEGAKIILINNYKEELIDSFLNGNYLVQTPFQKKELLFQVELLYYQLLVQHKTNGQIEEKLKQKFLSVSNRLVIDASGVFDYGLKMKMDEVNTF